MPDESLHDCNNSNDSFMTKLSKSIKLSKYDKNKSLVNQCTRVTSTLS